MPLFDQSNRPKQVFHPPAVWERIQHEFILGLASTRALAKKHGVRLSTLQARCKRESWVELRAERAGSALDDLILTGQSDDF